MIGGRVTGTSQDTATRPDEKSARMVTLRVADERLALPLEDVREILPALAFTSLPTAPVIVRGVANVRGTAVPLLDLRTRLHLPAMPPDPDHHVVLTTIGSRTVGLWVDRVESLVEVDGSTMVPITDVADAHHVKGVVLLEDGVLLVHDVASFLSAEEALHLEASLQESVDR